MHAAIRILMLLLAATAPLGRAPRAVSAGTARDEPTRLAASADPAPQALFVSRPDTDKVPWADQKPAATPACPADLPVTAILPRGQQPPCCLGLPSLLGRPLSLLALHCLLTV